MREAFILMSKDYYTFHYVPKIKYETSCRKYNSCKNPFLSHETSTPVNIAGHRSNLLKYLDIPSRR